jgi:hypothetical protein
MFDPQVMNTLRSKAANLLKAELKRKGVTYAGLVERLAAIGVVDAEANIRNKLSRGEFTAAFLLQCLTAIEMKELRVGQLNVRQMAKSH